MANPRKQFVVTTALIVAALHFVTGPDYKGPLPDFVNGYLIDILLPFTVYFLVSLPAVITKRWLIALLVFGIGFTVETMQFFGIPILGQTFDPLDYAMYALGVVLALLTDKFFFSKPGTR